MDWLGQAIGLPQEFLHKTPVGDITSLVTSHYLLHFQGSLGGGVIQTTASESTFVCLLAGRTEAIKRYQVTLSCVQCQHGSYDDVLSPLPFFGDHLKSFSIVSIVMLIHFSLSL